MLTVLRAMYHFSYFYNLFYDLVIVGFLLFLKLIIYLYIYFSLPDCDWFRISSVENFIFFSIFPLMNTPQAIYPYNKILFRYEKKCITDMLKQ